MRALRDMFQPSALPIGVDIGPGGARLIQLRRQRSGYCVTAAASVEIDAATSAGPWDRRLDAVLDGLRRRLESGEFSGRQCVLSVGDELLRVRSVRQPRMPREEADRALKLEGPERLGFTKDDPAEVGWLQAGEVRQGDDVRDEMIVVGAKRADLELLVDSVATTGLRPIAVEPAFAACGRAFSRLYRRSADQDAVRVIVDVGRSTTGVIVLRGTEVVFYKSLTIGGAALDAATAAQLEISAETASDLRRQRRQASMSTADGAMDPGVDRVIYDAVRPLIEQLAGEVGLCLRYYSVTFRGQRPECVLAVGADSLEPGLLPILGQALSIPARIGKPLDGVDILAPATAIDRRGDMVEWGVAVGLSMGGDQRAISDSGTGFERGSSAETGSAEIPQPEEKAA